MFQQVFNEYHSKLYYFIFSKTQSEYLAEEVVQNTFIKLWKYRSGLNESLSISTQLYRIATTTLIDLIRKNNTAAAVLRELKQQESGRAPDGGTDRIAEKELALKISNAVKKMPPMQRKVFELSREEGLSYREIAEKLSISVKTVEIHISKSLKFLKSRLTGLIIMVLLKIF